MIRADFAPFVPARGQSVAFVAAPLFADGELVGALVAAFDPTPLDRALSAGGAWQSLGLGDEGDVLLVGSDGALRSTPRRAPGRKTCSRAARRPGLVAHVARIVEPQARHRAGG